MNISYRGVRKELPPKLQEKLDSKFAKLSKLLEKRGEKEAHVVLTTEGRLHHAEITLHYYDHQLVGIGSDGDLFAAMSAALDKLETQAVKHRTKWREKKRHNNEAESVEVEIAQAPDGDDGRITQRVFRIKHDLGEKPMTLEEAVIEMEKDRDYVVYRDADKQCLSVLVRRRDGHFDLIES